MEQEHNTKKENKAVYTHLLNCTAERAFITRHNTLVSVLAEASQSTGITPDLELGVTHPSPRVGNHQQILERKRFDISVAGVGKGHKTIHGDVTVTSHCRREDSLRTAASRYPMYHCEAKARQKFNTYKNNIDPESEIFSALVFETSGAMHRNVRIWIAAHSKRVANIPPSNATWTTPSFVSYWMAVLSFALRRENAKSMSRLAKAARRMAGISGTETMPNPIPRSDSSEDDF